MSRIGNRKLNIPEGVSVNIENNKITVTGPKGSLDYNFSDKINVTVKDGVLECTRSDDTKESRSLHGTTNSLINNMIIGVSEGFTKSLEINGIGYRFNVEPKKVNITAGFSHPVAVDIPEDLTVESVSNTEIKISGIDKQKVSEFAAEIRAWRKPEPYKGKGIRYKGEKVRSKEGKKATK